MRTSPRPAKHARPRSTAAPRAIPAIRSVSVSASVSKKASATSRQWRSCARQDIVEQRVLASCSRLPQQPTTSYESRSYSRRHHDDCNRTRKRCFTSDEPEKKPSWPRRTYQKPAIGDFFRSLLGLYLGTQIL